MKAILIKAAEKKVVKEFYCVNVGSDYGVLMHYLLEM